MSVGVLLGFRFLALELFNQIVDFQTGLRRCIYIYMANIYIYKYVCVYTYIYNFISGILVSSTCNSFVLSLLFYITLCVAIFF